LLEDFISRDHIFMQLCICENFKEWIILSLFPRINVSYALKIENVFMALCILCFEISRRDDEVSGIVFLLDTCQRHFIIHVWHDGMCNLRRWMPYVLANAPGLMRCVSLRRDPESRAVLEFSFIPPIVESWVAAVFDD
jgi:hypothetical protein